MLQRKRWYVIARAMVVYTSYRLILPLLCLCLGVTACSRGAKKDDVLNIYELPRGGVGPTIYTTPVDNDNYYVQPRGYSGCAQVSDAPSCGGG